MRRPLIVVLAGALSALLLATVSLHPRASAPVLVLTSLLGVARLHRTAALLLVVLLIATLAGVRVDAAPPAPARVR